VFTARYALSPYIKQIRFVFKGLKIQLVPRSKLRVIKTSQLMPHREILVVCSEIHKKYVNTLCRQNVEFVNVKSGGT
jgi:hypothetical protein